MASLRRSSAKLRSLGSGHGELKLAVSQLRELRSATKAVAVAQEAAADDLTKWSSKEENRAIKDVVERVGELCRLWTDAQKQFADRLKEFRHTFEMILEGERVVDAAKAALETAESKEVKLKKEQKRLSKKSFASSNDELREVEDRLAKVLRDKDYADAEASIKIKEHEAVKMIRVKDGLSKFAQAQLDLSDKSSIIFSAAKEVADQIPDITSDMTDDDLLGVQYHGGPVAMQAIMKAKDCLKQFPTIGGVTTASATVRGMSPPAAALVHSFPSSPPAYDDILHHPQPPSNPYFPSSHEASFNSSGVSISNLMNLSMPATTTGGGGGGGGGGGLYPEVDVSSGRIIHPRHHRHSSYHENELRL